VSERLLTADTSVVIPALVAWHERHEDARRAIGSVSRLPGHVLCEVASVLTRLPHGLAVPSSVAVAIMRDAFPAPPLVLDQDGHAQLLDLLAKNQIRGKAVYDALIGVTAATAGAALLTLDQRAIDVYRATGVPVDYLD
jgi:predicted nucleic acid-binding protein